MDERCKEYPKDLQGQEGARYHTGCRLTVHQQWVSDTLIKGDEVFTAAIIKQKLEEKGYQVLDVEEYLVLTRESGEGKLEEVDVLHRGKRRCKRRNERLRKSSNGKRFSW